MDFDLSGAPNLSASARPPLGASKKPSSKKKSSGKSSSSRRGLSQTKGSKASKSSKRSTSSKKSSSKKLSKSSKSKGTKPKSSSARGKKSSSKKGGSSRRSEAASPTADLEFSDDSADLYSSIALQNKTNERAESSDGGSPKSKKPSKKKSVSRQRSSSNLKSTKKSSSSKRSSSKKATSKKRSSSRSKSRDGTRGTVDNGAGNQMPGMSGSGAISALGGLTKMPGASEADLARQKALTNASTTLDEILSQLQRGDPDASAKPGVIFASMERRLSEAQAVLKDPHPTNKTTYSTLYESTFSKYQNTAARLAGARSRLSAATQHRHEALEPAVQRLKKLLNEECLDEAAFHKVIEVAKRELMEKDPRIAVERDDRVVAATAELETQLARGELWLQGIPSKLQQLEFERALAAEREEKARIEAEQRRKYIIAERTRMLTQALLELRSELAAPTLEGAGRPLCLQAQRARYVIVGIRVVSHGEVLAGQLATESKHSSSSESKRSGLGSQSLASVAEPHASSAAGAEILELLAVDDEPSVKAVKDKLVDCVLQAEAAIQDTTTHLQSLLEQSRQSAKQEVQARAADAQDRELEQAATAVKLDASEKAQAKLEQIVAQLEAELSLATTKIEQLRADIAGRDVELAQSRQQEEKLENQLTAKDQELHTTASALEDCERKRARLEKMLGHREQDISELQDRNAQFRERINKLEGVLGLDSLAYEQTIDTLRHTNDKLRADLAATTARDSQRIESLEQELATERRDHRQLAAEESRIRKQKDEVELQLQEYKVTIRDLRNLPGTNLGSNSTANGQTTSDHDSIVKQNSEMFERRILNLTTQLKRVREQLAKAEAEENRQSQELTQAKKDLQRKEFDLDTLRDKLQSQEQFSERLATQVAERAINQGKTREEHETLERALAERTETILEKEKDIGNLRDEISELKRTQSQQFVPKSRVRELEDQLIEKEQSATAGKRRLEFDIKDLKSDLAAAKSRGVSEMERLRQLHSDAVSDLQRRLGNEQEKRMSAESELDTHKATIAKITEETTVLKSHIAQLKAECTAERTSAATQNRRVQALERQLLSAEQAQTVAQTRATNLDSQIRQLQEMITSLQNDKSNATNKAELLGEKVADLTRKNHTATLELSARQKQIRGISSELAAQTQLLKDAEWQIRRVEHVEDDATEQRIAGLRRQVREVTADLESCKREHARVLEAREKRQEEQERHIKELSELNRSLQSGQGLLEGEQSGLRRKVQHFESEITQLNSKNASMQREIDTLRRERTDLKRELDLLPNAPLLSPKSPAFSQRAMLTVSRQDNDLAETNARLKEQIRNLKLDIEAANEELANFKTHAPGDLLAGSVAAAATSDQTISSLKNEVDTLKHRLQMEEAEQRTLRNEYLDFSSTLVTVRSDFLQTISDLKSEHAEATQTLKDRLYQLQQEKELATSRLQSGFSQSMHAERLQNGLLDTIQRTNEEIKASRQSLEQRLEATSAKVELLEKDLRRRSDQLNQETENRSKAEAQVLRLRAELEASKERERELRDKIQGLKQKNAGLGKLVSSLQADHSSLLAARDDDQKDCVNREARLKTEITQLQLREQQALAIIAAQDEKLVQLGTEVGEMQLSHEAHSSKQSTLDQGIREVTAMKKQLAQDRALMGDAIKRAEVATLQAEKQRVAQVQQKQEAWKRDFAEKQKQQEMTVEAMAALRESQLRNDSHRVSPMLQRYLENPLVKGSPASK